MGMHFAQPLNGEFLLKELNDLDAAIGALSFSLNTMKTRKDDIYRKLDVITIPLIPTVPSPVVGCKNSQFGFEYRGQFFSESKLIKVYFWVVKMIWRDFPERRAAIERRVVSMGQTRRYIAQNREALFFNRWPKYKKIKLSKEIADGWYIDTNLNRERIFCLLPLIVGAAGMSWDTDVRILGHRS